MQRQGNVLFNSGGMSLLYILVRIDPTCTLFQRLEQRRHRIMQNANVSRGNHHITLWTMKFNRDHPDTIRIMKDKNFHQLISQGFSTYFKDYLLHSRTSTTNWKGRYCIFGDYFVREYELQNKNKPGIIDNTPVRNFRASLLKYLNQTYGRIIRAGTVVDRNVVHHLYQLNGQLLYAIPDYDHGWQKFKPHVSLIKLSEISTISNKNRNLKNIQQYPDPDPNDRCNPTNNKLGLLLNQIYGVPRNINQQFPLDPASYVNYNDFGGIEFSYKVVPCNNVSKSMFGFSATCQKDILLPIQRVKQCGRGYSKNSKKISRRKSKTSKRKVILRKGYKKMKKNGITWYVSAKTGKRVKKATATKYSRS